MQIIPAVKVFIFISYLILATACSHPQKSGELINKEDFENEFKTFGF